MAIQFPKGKYISMQESVAGRGSACAAGGNGESDSFRIYRIGQDRKNHAAQALHRCDIL